MKQRRAHRRRPESFRPATLLAALAVAAACSCDLPTGPPANAAAEFQPDPIDPYRDVLDKLGTLGSWTDLRIDERDGKLVVTLTGFRMTATPAELAELFGGSPESAAEPGDDQDEPSAEERTGPGAEPGDDRVLPGPTLILRDSVVLQENESFFAGLPTELLPGPDGSHFVFDAHQSRVLRFDRTGRPLRAYGRRGRGPGEFTNIMGFASFVHDDILAVADGTPPVEMELELFRIGSGRHLGRTPLAKGGVVTALAPAGQRLWAGGLDLDRWRALGSAPLDRVLDFDGGDRPVVALEDVAVPQLFVENREIMLMGSFVVLDVGKDDLLLSFRTNRYILRVGHDGEILDTIPMHPRERRGVPDDATFSEMATISDEASGEERNELHRRLDRSVSNLLHLSRDATGAIFMVHADWERTGERDFAGVLYVSSIAEDGSAHCSDTLAPASDVGLPIAALRGNELLVLDQRLVPDGGAGDLRTVVRRFTIDPDRCTGEVAREGAA